MRNHRIIIENVAELACAHWTAGALMASHSKYLQPVISHIFISLSNISKIVRCLYG